MLGQRDFTARSKFRLRIHLSSLVYTFITRDRRRTCTYAIFSLPLPHLSFPSFASIKRCRPLPAHFTSVSRRIQFSSLSVPSIIDRCALATQITVPIKHRNHDRVFTSMPGSILMARLTLSIHGEGEGKIRRVQCQLVSPPSRSYLLSVPRESHSTL